jgi:TPP-dependent pyruvate/acetoin dehydrogenase alpha subunit
MAASDLTDLASVFGIESVAIDGLDTRSVHQTMTKAVQRARAGDGPTFIEARTVRWPGNRPIWPELATGKTNLSMAWDNSIIPEEHKKWHQEQDGVLRFVRELMSGGQISKEVVLELDRETSARVREGLVFALDSPYPSPEEALEHVFAPHQG